MHPLPFASLPECVLKSLTKRRRRRRTSKNAFQNYSKKQGRNKLSFIHHWLRSFTKFIHSIVSFCGFIDDGSLQLSFTNLFFQFSRSISIFISYNHGVLKFQSWRRCCLIDVYVLTAKSWLLEARSSGESARPGWRDVASYGRTTRRTGRPAPSTTWPTLYATESCCATCWMSSSLVASTWKMSISAPRWHR